MIFTIGEISPLVLLFSSRARGMFYFFCFIVSHNVEPPDNQHLNKIGRNFVYESRILGKTPIMRFLKNVVSLLKIHQ